MNTELKRRTRCAACGNDVQRAGGKSVRLVSMPAEVRWQKAGNPRAALALVREARAKGIRPKSERVLCSRCAQLTLGVKIG
jgi:hypothetical protein